MTVLICHKPSAFAFIVYLNFSWRFLLPSAHLSTYFGQRFLNPEKIFKPYKNLLGGFYILHWRACAEAIAVDVKGLEIFCCPHFEKKKWHRNKELTAVEFEPGTAGSEITELPTKPRGPWRVKLIEKAIYPRSTSVLKLEVHLVQSWTGSPVHLFHWICTCSHREVL